MKGAGLLADR